MKKYFYPFLLLISIAALLVACDSTSALTIEVRHPAYIEFPEEIVNVAVVDNAGAVLSDNITGGVSQNVIQNSRTKRILTESFTQFLNEEKFFNDVKLHPSVIRRDTVYGAMRPLSAAQVQEISQASDVDGVISLDLIKLKEANLNIHMDGLSMLGGKAKLTILFRVYDAEGKPLAPAMMSEDSIMWLTDQKSVFEAAEYKDFVLRMSEGMVRQIAPHWEKQERILYTDATKLMKEGKKLATAGNWKEAAKMWGAAFDKEDSNNKHKARMASNIALANENIDDIKNALTWINIAKDLIKGNKYDNENIYINWYRKKLLEREKNMSKLKAQLGTNQTPPDDPKIDE